MEEEAQKLMLLIMRKYSKPAHKIKKLVLVLNSLTTNNPSKENLKRKDEIFILARKFLEVSEK